MGSADGRTGFNEELVEVFGLTGLCGLESLECFGFTDDCAPDAVANPLAFGFDEVV